MGFVQGGSVQGSSKYPEGSVPSPGFWVLGDFYHYVNIYLTNFKHYICYFLCIKQLIIEKQVK